MANADGDTVEDEVEAAVGTEEATEGAEEAAERQEETTEAEEQAEPEGIVVQIGDDEPEEDEMAKAPAWVRDLRKQNREQARRIKELEAGKAEDAPELGPKPTREGCDFDDEEYDRQLEAWYERKRKVDDEASQREEAQRKQEQAWQGKMARYGEMRAELAANDYEDVESAITDTLSVTQQGIIVQGADNPALVIYALGKNPKRLKDIAAIEDPIEFAFAVSKVEAQLKVKDRNAPPPPEKRTAGSTGGATGADATLDKLRAEAAKTGDYSKVIAYKRQKKAH